jgi:TPR repeat protein
MSRISGCRGLLCAFGLMAAVTAHADLAGAKQAYAARDYTRAFQLFREIAELGNVTAQENIAAMYVDGEGVKRDNAMGYAWALIARENGGNAAMQTIIDQLQPHLTDALRVRVDEVTGKYGMAALKARLLPAPPVDPSTRPDGVNCKFLRPVNPNKYFPPSAARQGISGSVFVEALVSPDGRAHHPHIWYSVPEAVLDEAGRAVAMSSTYTPPTTSAGVVVPCVIRFKTKFRSFDSAIDDQMTEAYQNARPLAEGGDAVAQVVYGLLTFDREKYDPKAQRPEDWFMKAAQSGNPLAQYLVGISLFRKDREARESEISKGRVWLEMAARAGQVDAKYALAFDLLDKGANETEYAQAFSWLEDAAKDKHRDGSVYLAALLAAGPDAARRNPQRAIELIEGMNYLWDTDPTPIEVRAAAKAQLGQFDDAQSLQKSAIRLAKRLGWNTAPQAARLAKYEGKTAWTGNLLSEPTATRVQ